MGVLFFLSSQSNLPKPPGGIEVSDKVWHALFYAVLGALLWRALSGRAMLPRALIVIAIGAAYGYSDEFHQRFTAGRTYDLADWGCDIIGASAGVLLSVAAMRLRRR
jgi:VanZ family protein